MHHGQTNIQHHGHKGKCLSSSLRGLQAVEWRAAHAVPVGYLLRYGTEEIGPHKGPRPETAQKQERASCTIGTLAQRTLSHPGTLSARVRLPTPARSPEGPSRSRWFCSHAWMGYTGVVPARANQN